MQKSIRPAGLIFECEKFKEVYESKLDKLRGVTG